MERFKKNILPITTYVRIDVKRLFRDKMAIFFVFIFPLLFLVIFGTIFGGSNDISFRVSVLNQSDTEYAKQFEKQMKENKVFEIDEEVKSLDASKQKLSRSQLDAVVIIPDSFGNLQGANPAGQATVLYAQNNEQAGQALATILQGSFQEINQRLAPSIEPFTVKAESTATAGLTRFDYTFSGILGFTLLSLGIFGPTSVFPRLKQRGVLRRYHMTTIKVWQYFTGNVISNSIIGLIAVAIMFIAAFTIFDLNMRGNYFNLAAVVVLGTILLFGIGLAIGGWAKNENQAAPLAQIATLPMMFLSGVFIPTYIMPEVLQNIAMFIPLTPIVEAVRLVITEGATLFDLGPQLAMMAGWTVVIYFAAFKLFRWE